MKLLDELIREHLSSEAIDRLMKEFDNKIKDCDSEEIQDLAVSALF